MRKILKRRNIKYYLIFYLIIEVMTGFSLIRGIAGFGYGFFKISFESSNFESFIKAAVMLLLMLILWILAVIFITLPVTIYLLARKSVDITHERQNRKYSSRENIIYYREKLKGISPATISIMQNLKVEEDKDLTATIMKLQLNKNISIEGDTIKVLSDNVSNLTSSEKRLFYMLAEKNVNRKTIEDWKNLAIEEAKKDGYVKDKSSSKGLAIKKVILIALFILCFNGLEYFGKNIETLVEKLDSIEISEEMEIHEITESENYEEILNVVFQGVATLVCFVGIFAWPIFYIVYVVSYQNKNNSLKRTVKGEKLTDEILGMKRFINDFSMLNEADKESVVLWDDYLVYAIVLEENDKIVDEILSLKDIKNFDAKLIIK